MKRSALQVLCIAFCLSTMFTSCSKDEDNGAAIVGTWEVVTQSTKWGFTTVVTEVMEFNKDKTGASTTRVSFNGGAASSEAYDFTYRFDGSNLTINSKDINLTTKASVSGQTLTIEYSTNGETFKREYTKLTAEQIKEREEEWQKEQEAQAILNKLVGNWVYSYVETDTESGYDFFRENLTFKDDYTGKSQMEWLSDGQRVHLEVYDFGYEVSEGVLTLKFTEFTEKYEVTFVNNTMTLKYTAGEQNEYTYVRVE